MDMTSRPTMAEGLGPYDTPTSGGLRFVVELLAWIAGPWAVAEVAGSGWAAAPALLILVALPALFNTPGDKNVAGLATPGPVRIAIEALLVVTAVVGAVVVWPAWAIALVIAIVVAMVITGLPRYRWLAAGAPLPPDAA